MKRTWGRWAGRVTLVTLILIHGVLPFTPVNQHPERRIIVASLVLAVVFALLACRSLSAPRPSFAVGLGVLLFVYLVSALTGASPMAEGWPIKLVFAVALLWAVLPSNRSEANTAGGASHGDAGIR